MGKGEWPDISVEEKRAVLKDWYKLVAMRDRGGLPAYIYTGYDPKDTGWAKDVFDKNMLKRYDYYER